jgi:hypothetical protein
LVELKKNNVRMRHIRRSGEESARKFHACVQPLGGFLNMEPVR